MGFMNSRLTENPTTSIQKSDGFKSKAITLFLLLSFLFFSWNSYAACPVDQNDLTFGTNSPYSGDCDLSAYGNINIIGTVVWTSGTVTISGNLTVAFGGSLTVDPATTINIDGNFIMFAGGSGVINGTINATGNVVNAGGNLSGNGYLSYGGSYFNPGGVGSESGTFAGGCAGNNCGDITLPVELVSFKGTNANSQVQLIWETASELNNEGFEVQKSTDGSEFIVIEFVSGEGTTSEFNTYSFTDLNGNQDAYYRLRQVDFDGEYEFSTILFIRNESNPSLNITIYPNPTKGNISVLGDFTRYTLMDTQGRTIHRNLNTTSYKAGLEISQILTNQESGIYFLKTQSSGAASTSRIIKE